MHATPLSGVKSLVKLCRLVVFAMLLGWTAWPATPAEQLFERAQKAERSGQLVNAYVLYAEAAAANPNNLMYWQRAQALRPTATMLSVSQPKLSEPAVEQIDPTLFGRITDQDLQQARKPLAPVRLNAAPGSHDFDFTGDSRSLWEQLAAALHLKVVFETQYQPTRPLRFQVTEVEYRDALRSLEAATNSFLVPVTDQLIFVANDTAQKRTDFERTAAIVVPFTETISVQEIQEVATSVRGTLDIQKLMVDTQRHLILIRDRIAKVRLAQKLLEDLMRPRAQVAIEVEILTIDRSSSLSYGMSLPSAFSLVNFPIKSNLMHVIPSGFTSFLTFGGGASMLGLGVTSASMFATVSKSNSSTVMRSEIVALDGQPSTLHVGDKYPIVTNAYIGGASTGTGQVFTPPPTFNFEDLGLSLKITPRVHGTDEVSLDISTEFKLLGAGSVDGIPVVSNKKYESKITVKTGEWAILAGLMTASESRTLSGIPLLSAIPLLRNNSVNRDEGQALIVLKPHLLVEPPTELPTWRAWMGSETRLPSEL
jgi:general secretion pathway protein D